MNYSKKIITYLLLQVFFTQAKGSCKLFEDERIGKGVQCLGRDITDLKLALGAVRGFIGSKISLYVETTGVEILSANTSTRAYKVLCIWNNTRLTNIHPMAFLSSNSSATILDIQVCQKLGNRVWEFASKMSALTYLQIEKAGLTEVPANAFGNNKSLNEIRLLNNGIRTFKAPLGELDLELLHLQHNNLNNDSFFKGVFEGKGHLTQLILWDNPSMTQLKKSQFKGLLDKGTKVHVGRSRVSGDKYMKCVGAEWLCDKKEGGIYLHKTVFGYECVEPGFKTIVDYCASLPSSNLTF